MEYSVRVQENVPLPSTSLHKAHQDHTHEETINLKRVVFDSLNVLLGDPAAKRPTWMLGLLPSLRDFQFDIEPLLRSALRLARNRCASCETTILHVRTLIQGTMLILQIDEKATPFLEGKCLVSVTLGQVAA